MLMMLVMIGDVCGDGGSGDSGNGSGSGSGGDSGGGGASNDVDDVITMTVKNE